MHNLCSESFTDFNDNHKNCSSKRRSNILNIDSLIEEIQLNWTVIINELTLNEDLYKIPGFSRYSKQFTNNFSMLFQPFC